MIQMQKIDAHQHFWQLTQPFNYKWLDSPNLARIKRDYLPDDLKPHLEHCGITGSIFVQTQHDLAENHWVLDLCKKFSFVNGIVGWVDLASDSCEAQLLEMRQNPAFLGVRHVVQDEPDDDFLIRPEILRGLTVLEKHGVPFDVLIYAKHLRHVPTLATQFPGLKMVINHLAKPQIAQKQMQPWHDDFIACSRFENVFCKLSGMVTEADWQHWKPCDLKPYIQLAIESFGPDRLMYGSDWPVCELAGSYEDVYEAITQNINSLSHSEKQNIFAGTASRFYDLPVL